MKTQSKKRAFQILMMLGAMLILLPLGAHAEEKIFMDYNQSGILDKSSLNWTPAELEAAYLNLREQCKYHAYAVESATQKQNTFKFNLFASGNKPSMGSICIVSY